MGEGPLYSRSHGPKRPRRELLIYAHLALGMFSIFLQKKISQPAAVCCLCKHDRSFFALMKARARRLYRGASRIGKGASSRTTIGPYAHADC